jgi:predicted alpha/beta-fold hydrolase
MMIKASAHGYKCVIVNFRGTSGVKLTSPKFYGACNWLDIKEPFDHIFDTYCAGTPLYNKRNMYGYGCSLGGHFLNLYLLKEGSKVRMSGAMVYCTNFDCWEN